MRNVTYMLIFFCIGRLPMRWTQSCGRIINMAGYLLLEGGAEFGGQMSEPDRRAMVLAGGNDAQISIIPTAAAPDDNYRRAGDNRVNWFPSLAATRVAWLPLVDKASANDARPRNACPRSRLAPMAG